MLIGSYSLRNLIQSEEFLLDLTKLLKNELADLEKAKEEVQNQQKEAQKQGQLVKKMTNYLSDELGRLELPSSSKSNSDLSTNFKKLTETENKLRVLRGRLSEFVNDNDTLHHANESVGDELKKYEVFLLDLTNTLNEKISSLEKITKKIQAERRESEHQKMLLKEMADLFNEEIEDLEKTFNQLKGQS